MLPTGCRYRLVLANGQTVDATIPNLHTYMGGELVQPQAMQQGQSLPSWDRECWQLRLVDQSMQLHNGDGATPTWFWYICQATLQDMRVPQ